MLDGVILHYFLHAEPHGCERRGGGPDGRGEADHRRRVAGKRMSFEIKNELEAGRPVGSAPTALISGRSAGEGTRGREKRWAGSVHVADKTAQTIFIDDRSRTVMDVIADIGSSAVGSEYKARPRSSSRRRRKPEDRPAGARRRGARRHHGAEYDWPADRKSVRWSLVSSSLLGPSTVNIGWPWVPEPRSPTSYRWT